MGDWSPVPDPAAENLALLTLAAFTLPFFFSSDPLVAATAAAPAANAAGAMPAMLLIASPAGPMRVSMVNVAIPMPSTCLGWSVGSQAASWSSGAVSAGGSTGAGRASAGGSGAGSAGGSEGGSSKGINGGGGGTKAAVADGVGFGLFAGGLLVGSGSGGVVEPSGTTCRVRTVGGEASPNGASGANHTTRSS